MDSRPRGHRRRFRDDELYCWRAYSHAVSGANEVSIWESELRTGKLPPICVKSGRAADRKLKFNFASVHYGRWAWLNTLLEILVIAVLLPLISLVGWLPGDALSVARARGPLPLTGDWREKFVLLRVATIAAPAFGIVALFSAGVLPAPWRLLSACFAIGLLGVYMATHTLYARLRPRGAVHRSSTGLLWIHLQGVHPDFVAAVEVMHAAPVRSFPVSPDGLWFWDGAQWLSTTSRDGQWKWDGTVWQSVVLRPK
jgi:hypothetical protein